VLISFFFFNFGAFPTLQCAVAIVVVALVVNVDLGDGVVDVVYIQVYNRETRH